MAEKLKLDDNSLSAYVKYLKNNKTSPKAETARHCKCNLWKWIMGFFYERSLLDRANITMGHLKDPPASLSVQRVKQEIRKAICKLLGNIKKNSEILKKKFSIFGLYESIMSEVFFWDKTKLILLDIGYGISLLAFVLKFVYFCLPRILNEHQASNLEVLSIFPSCCLSIGIFIAVKSREEQFKLKARVAIQQLVYEKLLISDFNFIEHTDSNFIHQILYSELEEYVEYLVSRLPWALVVLTSGIAISMALYFHYSLLALCLGLIWKLSSSMAIRLCMRKSYQQYKTIAFEERKLLYEFIANFHCFTMKNLKPRFSILLDRLRQLKLKKIKKLNTWSKLNPEHNLIQFGFLLSFGLLFVYVAFKYGYKVDKAFLISWTLPVTLTYCFLHQAIFTSLIKRPPFGHASSSRSLYDNFFDNQYVVEDRMQDDSVPLGAIIFEDCYILELEYNSQSSGFKKTESLLIDLVKENCQNFAKEIESQLFHNNKEDQIPISSLNVRFLRYARSQSSEHLTRQNELKLVIAGLSLTIEPGSKVCIFNNKNHRQIKGFLCAIMLENHLACGSLRIRGSISYLNTKKRNFLVGKTIRDNIIFGQDYNQERYDSILRIIGATFSNYQGQDMYQLNEEGNNMSGQDRRTILVARFLYCQSDIYIAEDFFTDINLPLQIHQIKDLFDSLLRNKTLIFVADSLEAIQLSQKIVCFEGEKETHVVSTQKYLDFLDSKNWGNNLKKSLRETGGIDGRVEVLERRFKNCIFVANISYEEELEIYKEQEKQKKQLESMKRETNNVLDFLAFGLYLRQKRKELGEYLDDDMNSLSLREAFRWVSRKSGMAKLSKLSVTAFFSLVVCEMACKIVAEYLTIRLGYELYTTGIQDFQSVKIIVPIAIGIFVVGKVAEWISSHLISNKLKVLERFSKMAQAAIFDSNISQISNKRSHRLIDCLCKDFAFIEIHALSLIRWTYQLVFEALASLIILTFTLSLWSVLIFAAAAFAYWTLFRSVADIFQSTFDLRSFISDKIDDKHYELLNLIASFRIGKKTENLAEHLKKLGDNYFRCFHFTFVRLKAGVMTAVHLNALLTGVTCLFLTLLCQCFPPANILGIDDATLIWSLLYTGKLFCIQLSFINILYVLLEVCFRFKRICAFMRKQEKRSIEIGGSLNKLDFSLPILFRKVSIKVGSQPVLKKISFKINHGSRVAILGSEGSFRSMIFDLFAKVRTPEYSREVASKISLFGIDLEDLPESFIETQIFVLDKQPFLFEGLVLDNIDPYGYHIDKARILMKKLRVGSLLRREELIQSPGELVGNNKLFVREHPSIFERLKDVDTPRKIYQQIKMEKNIGNSLSKIESLADKHFNSGARRKLHENCGDLKDISETDRLLSVGLRISQKSINNRQSEILASFRKKQEKAKTDIGRNLDEKRDEAEPPKCKYRTMIHENVSKTTNRLVESKNMEANSLDLNHGKLDSRLIPHEENNTVKTVKKYSPRLKPSSFYTSLEHLASKDDHLSLIEVNLSQDLQSGRFKSPETSRNKPGGSGISRPEDSDNILLRAIELLSKDNPNLTNDKQTSSFKISLGSNRISLNRNDDLTDENLDYFLSKRVGFRGLNIHKDVCKLILFTRAIITKPKLLLLYEDSLDFGQGISWNLEILQEELRGSTILCITKNNKHLLAYHQILFLDAGKIIEDGDPAVLFDLEGSWLHKYLTEVDPEAFDYLKLKKADLDLKRQQEEATTVRRNWLRTRSEEEKLEKPESRKDIENPTSSLSLNEKNENESKNKIDYKESIDLREQTHENVDYKELNKKIAIRILGLDQTLDDLAKDDLKTSKLQSETSGSWGKNLSEFFENERHAEEEEGDETNRRFVIQSARRLPKPQKVNLLQQYRKGVKQTLPNAITKSLQQNGQVNGHEDNMIPPNRFLLPQGIEGNLKLKTIQEMSEGQENCDSKIPDSRSELAKSLSSKQNQTAN